MKPYIIYNEDGDDYILQRKFPHYIGRITTKLERGIAQYPIAGYKLYVSFTSSLNGNYIQADKFAIDEVSSTMSDMAQYISDKIDNKYENYKI